MKITSHTFEELHDPTGILEGERYEFFLTIEVEEDDELFSENGLALRVIFAVDEKGARIGQYNFLEKNTNQVLDFALEEAEEELVTSYCKEKVESQ